MFRALAQLALLLVVGGVNPLAAQEGRLQQAREEVRSTEKLAAKSDSKKEKDKGTEQDSILGDLFGPALRWTVIAPFCLPHQALGDDWNKPLYFPRHPYQVSYPGYLMIDPGGSPDFAEKWGNECEPKTWGLQVSLENGNDFDGLNRAGGRIVLDSASRLGILTGWNYYHESLRGGRSDDMVLGDFNVTFRFAQNEWGMMRTGLGLRMRTDRGDADFGFNFHYGADFFPVNPVIVSSSIDLGNLGAAGVIHLRETVGLTRKGWEIFAGYDWLRIGAINLQGPMLGVRLWF